MREIFDKEHNFRIHEHYAHQIHQPDFNLDGSNDDDNPLLNLIAEGLLNFFNLFS